MGEWITAVPSLGLPSLSEPSVYDNFSGLCRGCQGISSGGVVLICVWVVVFRQGRRDRLVSKGEGWVGVLWVNGLCS